MASFPNKRARIALEEDTESLHKELDTVVGDQVPSSSAGTPNRTFRPATNVRSRLGRPNSACNECRRWKMKCNRKAPCDTCIEHRWSCNYDSGSLPRVDVQSVHSTQVQHQHLLETPTKLLGMLEDEVQMIMNAPTYPPSHYYAGPTLDVEHLRAVHGVESSHSRGAIPQSRLETTKLFTLATGTNALLPPALIAFSRPPRQNSNPSAGIFNCGRIPSTMVDLATRAFQANSIVVSHHVLAQLQVWQRVLAWEPQPSSKCSIPAVSNKPAAASAVKQEGGGCSSSRVKPEKTDGTVLVTAPPCEIEYRDQPTPKGLSVLALAHEVFVLPAITALQQAGGPNGVVSSRMLDSLLTLGSRSSSASTSSSQTPPSSEFGVPPPNNFPALSLGSSSILTSPSHPNISSGFGISPPNDFPALSLGSSSISTSSSQGPPSPTPGVRRSASPSSSISASPSILPLITPQVVLWNLPTQPWSGAFLREFDILMINHDGIGASGRHSILKKRIELMIEWADASMKRSGISDDEPGTDLGSKPSSPSSPSPEPSQRSGSIPRARGRRGSPQEESKPLPPPPSLGLFAVACAVYALGALSYGSKSIRGRFPEDGERTSELPATAPGAPLNPHMHSLPDKATPGNLLNLARAALLVHDESALPPSLDYLHAHMLTWLYLLHPSDSASSATPSGLQGSSTGIGSGGMTVVDQTIYKELGKCVSVARAMGLDLVDRRSGKSRRGGFEFEGVKGLGDGEEEMGIWEKEMRRRVWWQLMMFDQQISDNLGRPPLIPLGTYACKPPCEADESVFGPTAMRIPKLGEISNGFNTKYFATKCQLLAIIKTLPYAQHDEGVTLDLAIQLDARVSSWRSSLPPQYKIDFRREPEDTLFPDLDTVDVQACDLHIMANVFLLRLWLPFFYDGLSTSLPSSQVVLPAATTAAYAVIVASHHLVTHFHAARPMSFGHYDFGNSVWLATGVLASVVTMKSDVLLSSTAIKGLEIAGAVFHNQAVEGNSDPNHVPKYEVNKIMRHIERLEAQVRKGKGSSRSAVDLDETRDSIRIPYVGTAAMTTLPDISFPPTQNDPPLESAFGTPRSLPDQDTDETSSDSVLLTPHTSEMGSDLASDTGHPMGEISVAALAFAADVPRSRTSGLASRMGVSQTTVSQGKVRPVIGIRRRLPLAPRPPSSTSPEHVSPNSNQSRTRALASDVSFVEEPSSSHSTHNPSYSSSSSQRVAHLTKPPLKSPVSMRLPPAHQSAPPHPISHQDYPSQNFQHVHNSSLNITIGTRFTPLGFSQPPPIVSPDTYLNPMSQEHWAPALIPGPPYVQVSSPLNGAVNEIDPRPQSPLPQSWSSSASTLPQAALSTASPKVDAGFTNLHANEGPSVPCQPESYGSAAGVSHLSRQDDVGGFDARNMLPLSAGKPLDIRPARSSHLSPVIQHQYRGHSKIYPPHQFTVDPFSEETWDNVPDP